jgi:hypothetical protein
MTLALKIARALLAISIIGCLSVFALGLGGSMSLGVALLGAYAGIAIGLSAAACLLFQGLNFIIRKHNVAGYSLIAVLIAVVSLMVAALIILHQHILR